MTRISGLVMIAPLSWSAAPMRVKAGLTIVLAIAVHGHIGVEPGVGDSPLSLLLAVVSELILGLAMGFVVRLTIAVAEIAADVIGPPMGLGVAQVFDPSLHGTQTVLAKLFRHFAILLALLAGAHRVVISAVLTSFRMVPLGGIPHVEASVPALVDLSVSALEAGVRIAIPVLAILFMVQVALAFVSRAAPAMQIFSIGFAVTLSVGGLVLILAAPDTAYQLLAEVSRLGGRLETVLTQVMT